MLAKVTKRLPATSAATLWLVLLGLISLLIYIFVFVQSSYLPEAYGKYKPDFFDLHPPGTGVHIGTVAAFGFLAFLYFAAWRVAQRASGKAAFWVIVGLPVLFGLALLWMFPHDAADIFDYISHGRMTGVYHSNPYHHTPEQWPNDPFLPYVAWPSDPSPYGPVWELLAGITARLAGNSPLVVIIAYKLIPAVFLQLSTWVTILFLKRHRPRHLLPGVLLLTWNPVVLYEVWGNGHNDMVMVLFVLLAVLAFNSRRHTLGFLALTAGTLVKFIPALLVPAALVIAMNDYTTLKARIIFLLKTGAVCLAFTAAAYAPFWFGPGAVTVLERTSLFTSSIPAVIYYILVNTTNIDPSRWIVIVSLGITAAYAVLQTVRERKRGEPILFSDAAFKVLAFYLLVSVLWFQQWYTVWLIALAPVVLNPRLRALAVIFGFAALSKQFVAGAILWYPPRLMQPWLEIWFTLGVMGVPWAAAILLYFWKRKRPFLV